MHKDDVLQHSLQQRDLWSSRVLCNVAIRLFVKHSNAAVVWLCQPQLALFKRLLQAMWQPTFETPMRDGTMRSMSAQRYVSASFWPLSLLTVCSV